MKLYKKVTIITALVALVSLFVCFILHYVCLESYEVGFWVNILLALFGSAVLSAITSFVTYLYEKRQVLEGFLYSTRRILKFLGHYENSWDLNKKVGFFADYCEFSKDDWDAQYGKIDFFLEKLHHNRSYIFREIYTPIIEFNRLVGTNEWKFRWYLDGTAKNDNVLGDIVSDLEKILLEKKDYINIVNESNGKNTECNISECRPKLTKKIYEELDGRYYKIVYGKREQNK